MTTREERRRGRRQELDGKLKTPQGKEDIRAMWRESALPPGAVRQDAPSFFRMIDEILEKEFPPTPGPS
jgi:hypothetical protein